MKRPSLFLLLTLLAVSLSAAIAQKPASEKFKHAIERSEDSARLLSLLADPNSGFPKDLIDQAQIVAVFPRAAREDVLVRRFLHGYGVMSARGVGGWSPPAFYQFVSAPRKFTGSSQENLGLILLFMKNESLSWLEKDKSEFKRERAATLGPIGTTVAAQDLADKQILAYTYYNGRLNASNIDPDFFKEFVLDQDNKINLPLYGVKAREVLAGKKVDSASLPPGIFAFQEALQKYWPAR